MVLRAAAFAAAQKLHESVLAMPPDELKAKLPIAIFEAFLGLQETPLAEAGARNSRSDMARIQGIHDAAGALGANCSAAEEMGESATVSRGTLVLVESAATLTLSPAEPR